LYISPAIFALENSGGILLPCPVFLFLVYYYHNNPISRVKEMGRMKAEGTGIGAIF
jgi:hypothetical protein